MEVNNISQGRQQLGNIQGTNNGVEVNTKGEKGENQFLGIKSNEKELDSAKKDIKEVKSSVDKLNKLLEKKDIHLEYEIYGKFKDLTIRLVDNKTKEIIKEIPPKKIIDMVEKLCEMAGILVDQKA